MARKNGNTNTTVYNPDKLEITRRDDEGNITERINMERWQGIGISVKVIEKNGTMIIELSDCFD